MPLHKSKTILSQKMKKRGLRRTLTRGFTLIELLIVISIIGILAAIVLSALSSSKQKATYSRSLEEFHSIDTALEMYANDHGNYPPDASRNLPPGMEKYLGPGTWPLAPYPNSVYDWDSWSPNPSDLNGLQYPPFQQVYQISIRFCTGSIAPGVCTIPKESWAAGFDFYSALYYCISGPCRPHSSQPVNYPGKCVNC